MTIDRLGGSIVAIPTPFKSNGDLDLETFDRLVDWHLEQGTDALVVCGTTGETPTLTEEEDAIMIERAVKRVGGRIPVIAGTGSNSTKECITYSTRAVNHGADALLVVAPYYNKPTDKGLRLHFSTVAESVKVPVILYNVPGRTGSCISPKTAAWLGEKYDNIIGIKEAGGNLAVFADLLALCPKGFKILSGDDFLAPSANFLGAHGCISVVANVIPRDFHLLMKASIEGNLGESRRLFFKYKRLMELLFIESNPIPVKTALAMMGKIGPALRLPLCPMEEHNEAILREELQKLGLVK
ncbi:4-hydroxy-tetrahydrodipicolinate synthase [Xiashengella succiniciproducens]|jgi:4-hydroxy-tetrahydrodipicolinate synthase|uniref:4-hydroxy-tetrahydrodipicolinate synthase n=1 Tax=Xiashengella succiniciproducens TaxID=2949635 RepID=A0A9J6ZTC3_9BACT|nr:4-hydroxy-tetrahydrodipicolinate synthase [Alkaliflexus sp. Ai-910]URW80520.1 4-hydroxy-tetrahydrodipicolinate synthase [Alkaliflexus sp. Ai-910]HHT99919.1 4-hydroxy-tetrahydrodipicolinate synthase [Bacteroidales bacterium]